MFSTIFWWSFLGVYIIQIIRYIPKFIDLQVKDDIDYLTSRKINSPTISVERKEGIIFFAILKSIGWIIVVPYSFWANKLYNITDLSIEKYKEEKTNILIASEIDKELQLKN